MTISIENVWALLQQHQQETFYTAKGLPFTYTICGGELFVDRRQRSITISTVEKALEKIGRLQADGIAITGPKKIGCYGDFQPSHAGGSRPAPLLKHSI